MPLKRRNFSRSRGERRYRKMFVLAVEGSKTEHQYFAIFNNRNSVIRVNCLKSRDDSAPKQVLARMEAYLEKETLRKTDEAWLVVDKDQWNDEQLTKLCRWAKRKKNYDFALSDPKFEFWLLLHFEDGKGVCNSQNCSQKLEAYLPNYNKSIDAGKISDTMITDAIGRAKQRDNPPCGDWPRSTGTTVYKLVEHILKSHKNN